MQQNVGVLESVVRVGLGFGLMFVALFLSGPLLWAALVGFLVLAVSGFAGNCPLYTVLGISTVRR